MKRKELDGGDLRGLRGLRPIEDTHVRLDVLAARSKPLKGLVSQFTGSNLKVKVVCNG